MLTRLVKRFYRWRKWPCPYCRTEPMMPFEFLVNMRRYMGERHDGYGYRAMLAYIDSSNETKRLVSSELRKDLMEEGKSEFKEQCRCT